ncbi:MAG TPA: glycosyltransferase [Chitinophagaceae bacterium]|nr:glycosyltransferase [Chitinophagaceae bacterium]
MKRILWLASWYPNRLAPLNADFIQRHARAVSLYHEVDTIFVMRDATGKITKGIKQEIIEEGQLTQHIIYYYSPKILIPVVDRLFSQLKYNRLFKKYIRQYIHEKGLPQLVHLHVGMKAGLLAMWLKRKYNTPYIVTEHWTGFLPEAADRFDGLSFYLQKKWKQLWTDAAGISVVSVYLQERLSALQANMPPLKIIPNVVDTTVFYPEEQEKRNITQFIHVSELGFQKNPEAILEAFAIVKETNPSFQLTIFGPDNERGLSRIKELGLAEQVRLHTEVPQQELAKYVRQSDALILYSRYETFGCVVIEALASGIPAIVSDIPVMHELIQDGKNGILVKPEDPAALAEKILWFMRNQAAFDKTVIAGEAAAKYNYAITGKMFSEWYASFVTAS